MNGKLGAVVAAAVILFSPGVPFISPAVADAIYTYTGMDFDFVSAPYTTSDFVKISLTFSSALPDGSAFTSPPASLTSASFSDGINTITSISDISTFSLTTDPSGNIFTWDLAAGAGGNSVSSQAGPGGTADTGSTAVGSGTLGGERGSWTCRGDCTPLAVPGPIVGCGLPGLIIKVAAVTVL